MIEKVYKTASSNLKYAGYNEKDKILYLSFTDAKSGYYKYFDVPLVTFHSLLQAESKGSFFSKYVKNIYKYEKVTSPVNSKIVESYSVVKDKDAETVNIVEATSNNL